MAVDQLMDYLENGNITHSVNFPDCSMGICQTEGRVALLHHNSKGVIAKYTSVFGDAGINIADMTNKTKGEYAYTLIDIDGTLTPELLEKLQTIDEMYRVRVIK